MMYVQWYSKYSYWIRAIYILKLHLLKEINISVWFWIPGNWVQWEVADGNPEFGATEGATQQPAPGI